MTYSGYIGNTQVNSKSGYVTVVSLQPGISNKIEGSIKCTYSYDVTVDGKTTTYQDSKNSGIGKVSVNTHPGKWSWEDYIATNDIIEKKLTADLVNQWVDHLAAWKSWDTQQNYYSSYNAIYDPDKGTGYKVNSKDIIYMQWFNNCAKIHPRASQITHNNNEDLISLSRFSTLNFNGTGTNI